nr:hypothetical protein [Tanacetum cinerariifolium]
MKRSGFHLQQESSKKQKLDEQTEEEVEAQVDSDQEVEEMKLYMRIVPDEEIAIDAIPLATKPLVNVEYKIVRKGKISTYHITSADGSTKRYTLMINLLETIDREDLETLWKFVKDKHGNTRPVEENELSSTKAVYHKAFITLTKRVKKLETQLKKKRSKAVVYTSDKEEPSLGIEDSPKQERMIEELDKDENVNLVSEQGEVYETAEPTKDDDDATLAK